jgi:SAM-dependent methyltransferase
VCLTSCSLEATVLGRVPVLDEQRETWNALRWGWMRWRRKFERGGASVTARLLELGGVRPGHAVLDVGTGLGEPAIPAARLVGSGGHVVGVDVAAGMISEARRRAASLSNVVFLEGAVEELDLPPESFHTILSRWCLMLLADPGETLRLLYRLLVPDGVLAAAVWGPPETAPVVGLPFQVLSTHLRLSPPPPGQPGVFGMSDPQQCAARLASAGFGDVAVVAETAQFWFESSADYVRFAWDILPPSVKQMLADWCGPEDRSRIRDALARAATRYGTADGTVLLPSTVLCLRATKPARRGIDRGGPREACGPVQ